MAKTDFLKYLAEQLAEEARKATIPPPDDYDHPRLCGYYQAKLIQATGAMKIYSESMMDEIRKINQ